MGLDVCSGGTRREAAYRLEWKCLRIRDGYSCPANSMMTITRIISHATPFG